MLTTLPGRLRRLVANSSFVHPRTQDEHNFRLLCLNTAMVGVGQGGIVTFLPIFFARQGASPAMLGWLASAPSLMVVLFGLLGASVAERYANQVRASALWVLPVRFTYLLCALLPFWVPPERLLPVLLIVWTVRAIPLTVSMPTWTSVLSRAVSPQRRARLNGTRWAFMSVAVAASSALFGLMLDRLPSPLNYQLVFFISTLFTLLDPWFFSHVRVPLLERVAAVREPAAPLRRLGNYIAPVVRHKPFVVFLAATTLYRITLYVPGPLFTLYWVNDLAASDTMIGLRSTVGYAALVVGYLFWGHTANCIGHRRLLIGAAVVTALHPILTSFAPSAIWLLPIAVLWGLAAAGVDIGLFDITMASWPTERQPL
ncbi:MAG: MFS transporter, partial [Chloroflexi bacterium]|nr:MFS transporter [Chloroflexota bacterium]